MGALAGYFVGIGAQKAGSSWLGNYLYHHPQVLHHPIKEMHVFDGLYFTNLREQHERRIARRRSILADALQANTEGLVSGPGSEPGPEQDKLRWMRPIIEQNIDANEEMARIVEGTRAEVLSRYVDYFRKRVGRSGLRFGEVTPSYAMLPVEGFSDILEAFPDARFIFILRDPVDRLSSLVRDHLRRDPGNPDALLERYERDPGVRARSAYEETLDRLESVAPLEQILSVFYEDLFGAEDAVRRITDFLAIRYRPPDRDLVVNRGAEWEMSPEQKLRAAGNASATYRAIEERFGQLPDRWQEHRSLIAS